MVCGDDLIVLFSKSGNTEELVRLVPFAKVRKGAKNNVCCVVDSNESYP